MENATTDERTFSAEVIPKILTRRSFSEKVEREAFSFHEDDGVDEREDCLFVEGALPSRVDYLEAVSQGLTTPKPSFVVGLKVL